MAANDRRYMQRALELAGRGRSFVSPNPMVGCVIARGGKIIAEGWHKHFGGDHAEIDALKKIGLMARGATLYVNLEPCAHHGKTPPCVSAVILAKPQRVVIAMRDPNRLTHGKSIRKLRQAGIRVSVGVCVAEARELNRCFIKHVTTGMPYVIAKVAMSLDGKIAKRRGCRSRITGDTASRYVHELRFEVDAVLVGSGTVRIDDPRLNARLAQRSRGVSAAKVRHGSRHKIVPQPRRVILDSRLGTSLRSRLFRSRGGELVIFASWVASKSREKILTALGARVVRVKGTGRGLELKSVLKALGRMGVASLLVEGGARVFTSFRERSLTDEWRFLVAPRWIGSAGLQVFGAGSSGWKVLSMRRLGRDMLVVAR